mmetsp:Transcript_25898/g.54052  ORF Transcript_25898/g.54052 Transcript_25898/m.54052 type:complete len:244 (-) Transcript_25898:664-1395(-)
MQRLSQGPASTIPFDSHGSTLRTPTINRPGAIHGGKEINNPSPVRFAICTLSRLLFVATTSIVAARLGRRYQGMEQDGTGSSAFVVTSVKSTVSIHIIVNMNFEGSIIQKSIAIVRVEYVRIVWIARRGRCTSGGNTQSRIAPRMRKGEDVLLAQSERSHGRACAARISVAAEARSPGADPSSQRCHAGVERCHERVGPTAAAAHSSRAFCFVVVVGVPAFAAVGRAAASFQAPSANASESCT